MKHITIILICLLSVSCLTVRKVSKNCDLFEAVCVTDKEKEVEIRYIDTIIYRYRDTSFNAPVPPKIIYKEKIVYITAGIVNSDPLIMETDLCKSTSQVRNSKLTNELEQKDTTLKVELENALLRIDHWKGEYIKETNKETLTIQENKPFAKFAVKWFIGSLIVIVIGAGYLIFKFRVKLLSLFKFS